MYAVWMCRAAEAGSRKIATGAALLDRQRRHNATRLDWIVDARAEERGWARDGPALFGRGAMLGLPMSRGGFENTLPTSSRGRGWIGM